MDKVRVSAISYLNSIPFVYGLEQSSIIDQIVLGCYIPSVCAEQLLNDEVDLALTPVAILPHLAYSEILSPYCIGADGPVETVCLFSHVPMSKIKEISLDFHSKTSVQLVQVLCKDYWNITPKFIPANSHFEKTLSNTQAAVIIGERAYQYKKQFEYVYDLSEQWKRYTGLPFVFACWVANKPLSEPFKENFVKALSHGLDNLDLAIEKMGSHYPNSIDQKRYLGEVISYQLDASKEIGLQRFLAALA